MRIFLALFKNYWQVNLTNRIDTFVYSFTNSVASFVGMGLWLTAANSNPSLAYNQNQLISYFILAIIVGNISFAWSGWYIPDDIKTGGFVKYILKPMSVLADYGAAHLSEKIIRSVILIATFGLIVGIFRININVDMTIFKWVVFSMSVAIAFCIALLINTIIGLFGFWADDVNGLMGIYILASNLLAGRIIPVVFLPPSIQWVNLFLPLRYTVSFPVEVLIGQLNFVDVMFGVVMEVLWLAVLFMLYKLVLKKGVKAYSAFGS